MFPCLRSAVRAAAMCLWAALCFPTFECLAAAAADYVWLEGEAPARKNFEPQLTGWGNTQYLSGEKWLSLSVPDNEAEKSVPKDGIVLGYDFEIKAAGKYEVWNRIGYEFVRSPFQWRMDQDAWKDVTPEDLTTDLMEIAFWCEVAWLKMGEAELAAGKHSIEVRHLLTFKDEKKKQKGPDGKDQEVVEKKPQRILNASDCLCLYKGTFRPNGKYKPDEPWQTDSDKAAAAQVFEVKAEGKPEDRVETLLSGPWQICRFDEQEIDDRGGPIKALPNPDEMYWRSIEVPGDRNAKRPEMIFCHRYLMRTKIKVPAELKGRSFFLHFPSVNMIATVFVNGVQCGWTKAPFAVWDCDITKALKPGETNDLWIGLKDTYYGLAHAKGSSAKGTRHTFNIPPGLLNSNQGTSFLFDFPVWGHRENGILEAASLVACGPVYTSDVFAIPSVKKKELGLEVSLMNPTAAEAAAKVENEIVPIEGGAAEKTFAPKEIKVPAGQETTFKIAEPWENPKLWWPDSPSQYHVVTKVSVGGKVVDVRRTKFGFREWEWGGPQFVLNGVPWQGRADLAHHHSKNADEAIAAWKKHGQTMYRFWGTSWAGLGMTGTLDFMDKSGVPVRRSGIFDGEMANYGLSEEAVGPDGKKKRVARKALFDNWIHQVKAQIKGERNHPSVFVWSIENEIAFINSRNLGQKEYVEPELTRCAKEVMAMDPTRPAMVDGGKCLMDQSLPVNGCHYDETDQRDYPDESYTLEKAYAAANPWTIAKGRPIFMGESFFARGYNPAGFAGIGGESAFLGRSETPRPVGLYAKMLSEGYRWHGVAAFHYWFGDGDGTLHYNSWQPVCVLCRQWNWTFGGGTEVKRNLKVFNDTRHADPIEAAWAFTLDGKPIQEGRKPCNIGPGLAEEMEIAFKVPAVTKRARGEFVLTCLRGGKEVFREVKEVWAIQPDGAPKPTAAKADLLVLDPNGSAKARLQARGIEFTEAAKFEDLPEKAKVVVVGKDALTARQATDPKWYALAATGARILVLEQQNPLQFQALPADLEATNFVGRVAFAENLEHPIFAGLDQPDFFTWSKDHVVYRNVYRKASRGATSLMQCDWELGCSAIAACTVNEGLMLLCQMVVGEKLASDPVAQRLFDNMLGHCFDYKLIQKNTMAALDEASPQGKLVAGSGLRYGKAADVLAMLADPKCEIAVADASPENLEKLAANLGKVKAFAARGGWLMLWGLAPEGLASFNKVVGVEHLIRPFEMERVTLPAVRDPILSGLTMRDVVMESGQKIASHAGDKFLANDVYSYVVDFDDIAPFCEIPGPEYWNQAGAKPGFDHWPRNMVNGFTTTDSWKYIFSILLMKNEPTKWTMKLPREEEIQEFSICYNTIYHKVTKTNLYFDGDEANPATVATRPVNERQDFALDPPRKAKAITIELKEWEKSGAADVIGVDNIWIRVKRPPDFQQKVRPLLNIGALVKYPMGQGGVILNQLRILETESVPINAQKKKSIVATLLRNLGAVFAGEKALVAGANLKCEPVPLNDGCNQFLTSDKGWFDPKRDLKHFPVGENQFAGVAYVVRDFRTSPLPSCVMLAGPGVKGNVPQEAKGLAVGKKADALFLLHTFKRTREWKPPHQGDKTPPVVFKYVVNYAEGNPIEVPVRYGEGVDHWISKEPKGLKGAALAWAAPFPGEDTGEQALVYQLQWNNPRPDVEIKSVDLLYDDKTKGGFGVPALLAITAASALK